MADASCILSDKYFADHVKVVHCRVYAFSAGRGAVPVEDSANDLSEDLLSDRVGPPSPKRRHTACVADERFRVVRQAEIELRRRILAVKDIYTAASSSGLELWVYELRSGVDSSDESSLASFAPVGLTLTHETTFNCPFTYSLRDSPNTTSNGRYGPVIKAVTTKSLDVLVMHDSAGISTDPISSMAGSGGDPRDRTVQYQYFGEDACLELHSGALVRIRPYLQINGTLYMRITTQRCDLVPYSYQFPPTAGSVVYLLPLGLKAEMAPWRTYCDALKNPRTAYIKEFYRLLSQNHLTRTTLASLLDSAWVRLIGRDRRSFFWPIELIRERTYLYESKPILYDSATNSLLSRVKDPYVALANDVAEMACNDHESGEVAIDSDIKICGFDPNNRKQLQMSVQARIAKYNETDECSKTMMRIAALGRRLHPPMPPPTSPHTPAAQPMYANSETSNHHPTPVSSIASPSYSPQRDMYDIHELYELSDRHNPYKAILESAEVKDYSHAIDLAGPLDLTVPIVHVEPIEHMAPIELESPCPPKLSTPEYAKRTPYGSTDSELPYARTALPSIDEEEDYPLEQRTEKLSSLQHSFGDSRYRFGELKLGMDNMDMKYSTGGRFFANVSSDSELAEITKSRLTESPYETEPDLRSLPQPGSATTSDIRRLSLSTINSVGIRSSDSSDLTDDESGSAEESDEFVQSFGALTRDAQSPKPLLINGSSEEITSLSLLDAKCKGRHGSIKLDLENFRLLIPQIVFDRDLLQCLTENVFFTAPIETPDPYLITLLKPLFSNMQRAQLNPDAISRKSAPKLQFLNPPLVSVLYGEERLRARITILKFWQLLGLKPEPSQRTDITVVLMAVDVPVIREECQSFLKTLKQAYESSHFGRMDLLNLGDVVEGFCPVPVESRKSYFGTLSDCFEKASMCLYILLHAELLYTNTNLLVITLFPSSKQMYTLVPNLVPNQLARGFRAIKNEFERAQWMLFDLNAMISESAGLVCSDYEYELLALLAYMRFHEFSDLCSVTGLIPQTMGFQYKSAPTKYLLEEEPVLHVAYCIKDHSYVIIAVTDQWTKQQQVDILKIENEADNGPAHVEELRMYANGKPGFPATRPDALTTFEDRVVLEVFRKASKAGTDHRLVFARCGVMEHEERLAWSRFHEKHADSSFYVIDVPHIRGIRVRTETPIRFREEEPNAIVPTDRHGRLMNSICLNAQEEIHGVSINGPEGALASGVLMQLIDNTTDYYMFEIRLLLQCGLNIAPRSAVNRILGQLRRLASLSEVSGASTRPTLVPWHVLALAKLESTINKTSIL